MLSLALVGLTALAPSGAGQVEGSKHDFSGEQAGSRRSAACTFCHTPHGAIRSSPTWNHTLANNVYRWSSTITGGGTPYPSITQSWTGSSVLCLSCHDGSVAIGSVAWFNGRSWVGSPLDPDNHDGDNVQIGTATGNLQNNHPFAFPYPFGGVPSTYNGVTTGGGAIGLGFHPDPTANGIRLFRQAGSQVTAGTAMGGTGIECASCHDLHNDPANVEDDFFLRGSRDADDSNYICRKCHLVMGDYQSDRRLDPHRPR